MKALAALIAVALGAVALTACAGGPPRPAALDTSNEACAWCRMVVSNPRYAAQIVAPGEEPRFFDDVGCLKDYLKARPAARDAIAFVADHRTGAWVPAESAFYTRVTGLQTPMGSHIVAHADAASRDQDPEARAGVAVAPGDVGAGRAAGDAR